MCTRPVLLAQLNQAALKHTACECQYAYLHRCCENPSPERSVYDYATTHLRLRLLMLSQVRCNIYLARFSARLQELSPVMA